MERMKKEIGTLSGVGTIYLTAKEIKGEFYIKVSDFTRCIKELEEENKKLKERLDRKEELNKSYRKEIKDHQFYEKKLEHRIIEFEELLHGE